MSKKNKSELFDLIELHFISSLALEQSVALIGKLADAQHHIAITKISADEYEFQLDYVPRRLIRSTVIGTMQRWNSTETMIEANGVTGFTERSEESKWADSIFMVIVILCCLPLFSLPYTLPTEWHIWSILLIFTSLLVAVSVGAFLGGLVKVVLFDLPFRGNASLAGFNTRYQIFEFISDTFKSVGDFEKLVRI